MNQFFKISYFLMLFSRHRDIFKRIAVLLPWYIIFFCFFFLVNPVIFDVLNCPQTDSKYELSEKTTIVKRSLYLRSTSNLYICTYFYFVSLKFQFFNWKSRLQGNLIDNSKLFPNVLRYRITRYDWQKR